MKLFEVALKGIPRSQMPQIHVEDIKDDFDYRQGKLSLKKMKPVQTERVESEYKKAVQKIKSKQAKPILLDKNLRIVNGHHRYDAYRHLGFDSVPAVIVDATLEDLMSKYQHTSEEAGAGGAGAGGGAAGGTGGATSSSGDSGSADSGDAGDSGSDSAEATPPPQPSRIGFFIGGWAAPSKKKKKKKKKNTVDFGKSIYEGYVKPQFDVEWDEAQRYPEFEKLGKEEWIKLAKTGKPVTIKTAKDINNTDAASPESFYDLDKSKQQRALQQVARAEVEMPIVARYSDGYKELLGGNTRLTAMMLRKGSATVWQFDVPDEILDENFADGKVKGKSRPGRVKKAGASCKGSVSSLRAKAKKYSGERGKMYHWCANMKSGRKKK